MRTLLNWWYSLLVFFGLKRPGRANPRIISVLENHAMADTMVYTLDLGPFDPDTEVREVTIAVEGVPQGEVVNVDPRVDNTVKVSGPQDAKATITIIDVDDAGNKAVPVVHEQVLLDTVAPSPGAVVTVVAVEEIPEEDPPAEDPPAEDPPAEDPPAEDPPAEDPPAEDPPAEDPPAEDPPAEDPPAEDPPAEDPPAEDPPAEDPPAEEPPAEDPPAEDPPAEDPPADEEPIS